MAYLFVPEQHLESFFLLTLGYFRIIQLGNKLGLPMTVDLNRHEMTKARLKIAKSSMSEIAREIGVSHSSITVVSQGYRRSARIEAAIASKLGMTAVELHPERYPQSAQTESKEKPTEP